VLGRGVHAAHHTARPRALREAQRESLGCRIEPSEGYAQRHEHCELSAGVQRRAFRPRDQGGAHVLSAPLPAENSCRYYRRPQWPKERLRRVDRSGKEHSWSQISNALCTASGEYRRNM
jgi:hypothetical protein